jgi:trans-aconitate methyltransferase
MSSFEWNPETYLAQMLAEIPGYDELQTAAAAATEGLEAQTVLELGTGTGETALRVLALHPNARWTGIDASDAMLARARERLPHADPASRASRTRCRAARSISLSLFSPCITSMETLSAICSRESRK